MALSKPTLGVNTDYAARIGALFDKWNDGNYEFPATQVPSADPNTLDDYEEGTWTPVVTFATPGDLSVTYTSRPGDYTKIGREVRIGCRIVTATFTHATASGNLRVTGNPFTPATAAGMEWVGGAVVRGITKANYTNFATMVSQADTTLYVEASGSAQVNAIIAFGDMPTGGSVVLNLQTNFRV